MSQSDKNIKYYREPIYTKKHYGSITKKKSKKQIKMKRAIFTILIGIIGIIALINIGK